MSKEELNSEKYLNNNETLEIWIHVQSLGEK